jgi:hypothetical protein
VAGLVPAIHAFAAVAASLKVRLIFATNPKWRDLHLDLNT